MRDELIAVDHPSCRNSTSNEITDDFVMRRFLSLLEVIAKTS